MQCKVIAAEYQRNWRYGILPAVPKEHNHPSLHCYQAHGCRCQECKAINARRSKKFYHTRIKTGRVHSEPKTALSTTEIARLRKLVGFKEEDSA